MQIQLILLGGLLKVAVVLIITHIMAHKALQNNGFQLHSLYGPGVSIAIWYLIFELTIQVFLYPYVDELTLIIATAVGIVVASITYVRIVPAIGRHLLSSDHPGVLAVATISVWNIAVIFLILYGATSLITVLTAPGDLLSPCLMNL